MHIQNVAVAQVHCSVLQSPAFSVTASDLSPHYSFISLCGYYTRVWAHSFGHFLLKHLFFMESRPLAEHCACDTVFHWQTQHVTHHSLSLWLNVLSVDIRFDRITYPPSEEMFKLHTV